jgi:hypothetical protein
MNFSYQRTALQAVGWYLTFLVISNFFFIAGSVSVTLVMGFDFDTLDFFTFLIIPAYYFVLAYALVRSRLTRLNIVLAVSAPLLSAFAGVLLAAFAGLLSGLIPLAILTTRPTTQKPPAEIGEVFK